ncbi:murein transglycosylase domain-containing protein [Desulfovibrio mangrovi]|uniref:murein transglycosylase domain-containing protein n=1 Tax=Desulfovibrio mangrovi TaxID=2976983 RepID=UPI0022486B57|nr:murein transglycosylase domain-containing protein [Desulfovibrio mangrovi]UZP68522.1 murein transglycosylase domain-containing protein [Desulfovibrio mangrovi]
MNRRDVLVMGGVLLAGFMSGCTASEAVRAGRLIATGDAQGAGVWAAEKGTRYALNPKQFEADLKRFAKQLEAFRKAVGGVWGDKEVKEPEPKKYVKYTQNYLSRALVDFDKGLITVETVDAKDPQQSLKNAIVTTLLTPYDPRGLDLWSAGEVKLGGTPFLLGEVHDYEGQSLRYMWRTERFADMLIRRNRTMRQTQVAGEWRTVHSVEFPMVKDHGHIRALKYKVHVDKYSRKFGVSSNLVYSVIKTESDFNPWAVSHVPAYGLMQIVPKTAGHDVFVFLHGKEGYPSSELLYQPEQNIQYGSAYLHLLNTRYLGGVQNPVSREYCVIAGYNGGAGNVLRTFHADRKKAVDVINGMSPQAVYDKLTRYLPYQETRRYLWKVVNARKEFVGLK